MMPQVEHMGQLQTRVSGPYLLQGVDRGRLPLGVVEAGPKSLPEFSLQLLVTTSPLDAFLLKQLEENSKG